MLAAAIATAALASATSAHATNVDALGNNGGEIWIYDNTPGTDNDITIEPLGRSGPDLPIQIFPVQVRVTDAAETVQADYACRNEDAHTAICSLPGGFEQVDVNTYTGRASVKVRPAKTDSSTLMDYDVWTREGDDDISIPFGEGLGISTGEGRDTIDVVSDPERYSVIDIKSGAGDDQVRLAAENYGTLDCGEDIDTAVIAAPAIAHVNCETVTGG